MKPENVLVDEDGYPCLADFGLAKILEGKNLTFSFCGTNEYMAPEMIMEQGHNYTIDWWTLGILTYKMVLGYTPFYTNDQIKTEPITFPGSSKAKVSD